MNNINEILFFFQNYILYLYFVEIYSTAESKQINKQQERMLYVVQNERAIYYYLTAIIKKYKIFIKM